MGKTLYLMSSGELKRKDNTIVVESDEGRKFVPVETTDELMVFGEVSLNKRFLEFCTQAEVMLHFFNHHGYYQGSYYPREHLNAGAVVLAQAKHYLDEKSRLIVAKNFVSGAIANMETVLEYYRRRGKASLATTVARLEEFRNGLDRSKDISELMGQEGNARESYYSAFDDITGGGNFAIEGRTRRPPQNRMNALISFLNSLCYTTVLSQIYRTHLDPRIGYLHETNFRRFTLNLDLAEIFKPILVDRLIFSLLNKGEIQKKHFSVQSVGGIHLSERGRPIVLKAWEERLQATVEHPKLKRKVSYRGLIRLEAYKLQKHLLGDEPYAPFTARW